MTSSKQIRMMTMLVLTGTFFLVELVCGYATGSLALISDSFHMLSDVASLVIALYATVLAKSSNYRKELSYGLRRAEVIGALINGAGLLALSFTIFISAIQRFVEPEEIKSPFAVLYVAGAGLIVNILGLFLFHDHSHRSHDHSHDHKEHKGHKDTVETLDESSHGSGSSSPSIHVLHPVALEASLIKAAEMIKKSSDRHEHDHENAEEHQKITLEEDDQHHHHDLNMRGVFLHILGDFLGSIGVIISVSLVLIFKDPWTRYMDPLVSILISMIIVFSTIPLVKSACYVLLQGSPMHLSVEEVKRDILNVPGVADVHELHVWQLSDTQTIASVHVLVQSQINGDETSYMKLATTIKSKLHSHGIHSTTVQPEYVVEEITEVTDGLCYLQCTSQKCQTKTCCPNVTQ